MARHRRASIAALILLGLTAVALAQAAPGRNEAEHFTSHGTLIRKPELLGTLVDNGSIFAMHQIYDTLVRATPGGVVTDLADGGKCPLMERRGHSICARRVLEG